VKVRRCNSCLWAGSRAFFFFVDGRLNCFKTILIFGNWIIEIVSHSDMELYLCLKFGLFFSHCSAGCNIRSPYNDGCYSVEELVHRVCACWWGGGQQLASDARLKCLCCQRNTCVGFLPAMFTWWFCSCTMPEYMYSYCSSCDAFLVATCPLCSCI